MALRWGCNPRSVSPLRLQAEIVRAIPPTRIRFIKMPWIVPALKRAVARMRSPPFVPVAADRLHADRTRPSIAVPVELHDHPDRISLCRVNDQLPHVRPWPPGMT